MLNIIEKKINWAGRELVLQTGKIARQADGAVVASYGKTSVLATVVFAKKPNYALDFFPLTVHYQDKYYAVGKIPGGFFKREGKPTEREILISRLIDRPIRPLFDERFRNEVQVIVTTLSSDGENSADVLAIIAASAALAISGIPMNEVVGAAKIGFIDGEFVVNPTVQASKNQSMLELVVAGTNEGILMVESEAKELSEEQMLSGVKLAQDSYKEVISAILDLQKEVGKAPVVLEDLEPENIKPFIAKLNELAKGKLEDAFATQDKVSRVAKIELAKTEVLEGLKTAEFNEEIIERYFGYYFKLLEKDIVRQAILNTNKRIDGRNLEQIRNIYTEVDLFKFAHGSALFTRGETQALVFTTLGTEQDEQILDTIESDEKERFMLHYNFPAYSVGEVGRYSGPGRREIGHGKLAWRALHPLLPSKDVFPYTIRIVSEITESNGSSSMATVCGASLSLMAAGVPLAKPVAGIAMGLIKESDKYAVLSDILGDEDHLGDMDFKVAGTKDGITSLQMDIKITSVTYDIMEKALAQAKEGRFHIMNEMNKTITEAKKSLADNVSKFVTLHVNKDKIKDIIGAGGKTIKGMCAEYNVKIEIADDGLVKIFGVEQAGIDQALAKIEHITAVPEIGKVYKGRIVKILPFGAFINFLGNQDGFLHISEVTSSREDDINNYLKVGDTIDIKVLQIDDKGKVRLTIKI